MDAQTNPFSILSFIVAPAVLTNASSILILSTSNRLARAVDSARELTAVLEGPEQPAHPQAQAMSHELTAVQQRTRMLIRALRAIYIAVGGFASAALLSLLGAVLTPVLPSLLSRGFELVAVGAGIIAVMGLVRGAVLLVRETRIAVGALDERVARVQAEFTDRR
jgi:uncharacterized protein DUF2721